MSPLPPHASLDHLKHQAKDLLRGLRANDPDAKGRALAHLPRHRRNEAPRLSDAQLIVAREYGYVSWPRLKEHLEALAADPGEDLADPADVQIATILLSEAMEEPWPRFSLLREGVDLIMAVPGEGNCHVAELLPGCRRNSSAVWELPLPTGRIWDRFLHMAELDDPFRTTGSIRISDSSRFPRTEWTITVQRDDPDRLDFTLSLDRIDATMPSV